MDPAEILATLKRLDITDDKIAAAIGRDRTAATRMMGGKRNLKVTEIPALLKLIEDHATAEAEPTDPISYVSVEVLPSYAGMGGGGSGEGDRETALISRRLVEDELRARASDMLLIEARGDSMSPDFVHGDQILIDRRDRNPIQPGPFALFDGDGYVIKLVERMVQKRGWYRVFSANDRYTPYEVAEADIQIMGRPVWFGRRL